MSPDTSAPPVTSFPGSGLSSRLRAELEIEANALAARTKTPFAMPVKQILAAIHRVIDDLPRVPDYDRELAGQQLWRSASELSLTEIDAAPDEVGVFADEQTGAVGVTVHADQVSKMILLDVGEAEQFFLAGLAAVAHLRRHRQ